MGLLNDLAGSVLGGGGSSQNQLLELVLNLVNNKETGGLAGLAKTFAEKGLGDAVSSWIGTGQNQPVSGDQITQALGSDQISDIAQKLGLGQQDAANGLAGLLPDVVDKLTPNGHVPDNDLLEQGLTMLKGKLFGQ
ncbi:MAG: hypothetical protein FD164_955 [Nitrospirae bacterium]|nr:MAG: hypothetical protein FD164_955 [Nitrospirota bacterium]